MLPAKTSVLKIMFIGCMVILSAVMLSACSAPPQEPSPPPQLTEAPEEEGQTITLITPDAQNLDNLDSTKYQIQTRLTEFHLLSETEGLAWGVTKNELRLYVTGDNGRTWANISPAPTVQFLANPVYGKEIFFTDKYNGWIVRSAYGKTEAIVLRTQDGGETWKVSSLGDSNAISSIYFSSSTDGWIMTTWDATSNKESKALYATHDGGATWTAVMQNEIYNPNNPNQAIPMAGVITGMLFKDVSNGFVTLQTGALPKQYRTKDGGNTWAPVQFLVNDRLGRL